MFRNTAVSYKNAPGTEGEAVKNFLESSKSFQKMKEISQRTSAKSLQEMREVAQRVGTNEIIMEIDVSGDIIKKIENACTFADILKATEKVDFNNSNDPTVAKIGSFGMKCILSVVGFFRDDVNFAHYMLAFRESVIQTMIKQGYSADSEHVVGKYN